jgi:sec-independent protein translocase protein TatC
MSDKIDSDEKVPNPDEDPSKEEGATDRARDEESVDSSSESDSDHIDEHKDEEYFDDYESDYEAELEAEAAARREAGMSFLEHLEEFRWTVGRSVLAFFVGLVIVAIFIQDIAGWLKYPILSAYGSVELVNQNLITYRPMGVISVFFQIALLGGFTLSMPFVLYFIAAFVAPGLTDKERRVLRPACFAAFMLFLTGVAFAFFIILPLTLAFSVRLNQYFGFELLWAASDYYNMVVWFSLATGAFFQFPLLIVILVYLQVLPVSKLKTIRKGVFVGLMIFSALMSPGGDFISLPLTTGFMYGLYELAIWVGTRIEKKKREEALADLE